MAAVGANPLEEGWDDWYGLTPSRASSRRADCDQNSRSGWPGGKLAVDGVGICALRELLLPDKFLHRDGQNVRRFVIDIAVCLEK